MVKPAIGNSFKKNVGASLVVAHSLHTPEVISRCPPGGNNNQRATTRDAPTKLIREENGFDTIYEHFDGDGHQNQAHQVFDCFEQALAEDLTDFYCKEKNQC